MAAGTIITVLSKIPWGQVVDAAPKVADGAAKLWSTVTRKKPEQAADTNTGVVADTAQSGIEVLQMRLVALEKQVLNLQDQMGASTELIKTLAEQNAQLVKRVELNRARLRQLAATTAIGAVILAGIIVYFVFRS
ncbi:MAG TPA: hypothetical protein PLI90_02160 [Rhodocyclaceae bacterium]|jgi:DNA uptake protein ComE-like DNA-binding protein|nr:hypothetical protein [Rhodocyclaceae bacterium]